MLEFKSNATPAENASNRSFGVVFTIVFALIAFWPVLHGGSLRLWALAASVFFFAAAYLFPGILTHPNRLWMKLGHVLGMIVSPIALGIVFFVSVVPVGLIMRLMRKDLLRLKYEPALDSYWITRTPPGPEPKSMTNQF